ncbi:MAG: hypothetical protein HYR56_21850 [Acidobacteria bacterium]|nr:hypothetical protein [Acidobacteriota bacterium]MBI3425837.1 hypothetical protein [Acidobacteriota bacterium]
MNFIANTRFAQFVMLPLLLLLGSSVTLAQTTSFTYQGRLIDGSGPATGAYDLQFKLFDALSGGTQVGTSATLEDVAVSTGSFNVTLDFGAAAFPGASRWLEIAVRPGVSTGAFTLLTPRQPITSTPYTLQSLNAATALNATNAATAVNFSGTLAGAVTGTQNTTALANNAVTTAKLADGSVINTKLADGSITNVKIADVAGSKITGSLTTATIPGANVTGVVANATTAAAAVTATTATSATNATTAASADALSAACNGCVTGVRIAAGQVVKSLNGLFDSVTLAAGSNITLTPAGNTLTISAASAANNWSLSGNAGTTPGTNFLGTTDNQPLVFKANAVELMRLSASGNLGLGTITPGSKLTVAGVIETTTGGLRFPDGTTQITASNSALSAVAHDASLSGNGTSGTPLVIAANGVGTAQLADNAVTSTKIVASGVGTTQLANNAVTGAKIATGQVVKSLNGLFDVVTLAAGSNITLAPSGNTLTIATGGAANNWSLTGNAGSTPSLNFLGTTDNQPLAFRINGAEVMRLNAGGGVGIGTVSPPLARLHVEGTSNAAAQVLVRGTAGVDPSIELGSTESGSAVLEGLDIKYINSIGESVFNNIYTPSTNAFRFQSGGTDRVVIQSAGNVGIGTPTPGYKLDVADRMRVRQGGSNSAGIWFYQTTPANDRAFVGMADDTHIGLFGNTGAGFGLTMNTTNGGVGIGTTDVSQFVKLDVNSGVFVHAVRGTALNGIGVGVWGIGGTGVYGDGGTSGYGVNGISSGNIGVLGEGGSIGVKGSSTDGTGGYFNVTGNADSVVGVYGNSSQNGTGVLGTGRVGVSGFGHTGGWGGYFKNVAPGEIALFVEGIGRMNVLQVAGSDVAERFDAVAEAKPGLVVTIDPDRPGQLAIARRAYNRRVAGVISGANKLEAGMVLADLSGSKNSLPVALSGRVWVYCDATRAAIQPGDLLTTSNIPGHAMKVTNHAKAQGAIIGKAMTGLKAGRGLVLVLVTLQ